MTDEELIAELRRAAWIWFKSIDLLLLEEFIRRYKRVKVELSNERSTRV